MIDEQIKETELHNKTGRKQFRRKTKTCAKDLKTMFNTLLFLPCILDNKDNNIDSLDDIVIHNL
ncbi:MAG: hypothetical protein LBG48_01200 [Rickettsiales bacterium]|jgi:hypothetical protein|nr:hypothetical protein [Rickettsiales bacterium]